MSSNKVQYFHLEVATQGIKAFTRDIDSPQLQLLCRSSDIFYVDHLIITDSSTTISVFTVNLAGLYKFYLKKFIGIEEVATQIQILLSVRYNNIISNISL